MRGRGNAFVAVTKVCNMLGVEQLDEILSELTPEMYHQMCQNVAKVAHKMRLGAYLQAAVTKLEYEVTK